MYVYISYDDPDLDGVVKLGSAVSATPRQRLVSYNEHHGLGFRKQLIVRVPKQYAQEIETETRERLIEKGKRVQIGSARELFHCNHLELEALVKQIRDEVVAGGTKAIERRRELRKIKQQSRFLGNSETTHELPHQKAARLQREKEECILEAQRQREYEAYQAQSEAAENQRREELGMFGRLEEDIRKNFPSFLVLPGLLGFGSYLAFEAYLEGLGLILAIAAIIMFLRS